MLVVKAYLRNGNWIKVEVKNFDECVQPVDYPGPHCNNIEREMSRAKQEAETLLQDALDNFDRPTVKRIEYWEKGNPTEMNVYKP